MLTKRMFPALMAVLNSQVFAFRLPCIVFAELPVRGTDSRNQHRQRSADQYLLCCCVCSSDDPVLGAKMNTCQPPSASEAFRCLFPFPLRFQIWAIIVFVGLESPLLVHEAAAPTSSVDRVAGSGLHSGFNADCQPEKYDDPPKSSRAVSPGCRTGLLKHDGKSTYFAQENSFS